MRFTGTLQAFRAPSLFSKLTVEDDKALESRKVIIGELSRNILTFQKVSYTGTLSPFALSAIQNEVHGLRVFTESRYLLTL